MRSERHNPGQITGLVSKYRLPQHLSPMSMIWNNSRFELRQAVTSDAEAIRRLVRNAYAKWVPLIGREPLPMSADYEAALKMHRFDLLVEDDELGGLIETIRKSDHLLIENIAVTPECQGRGYGRMLMDHAEWLAASRGYSEIKLYTNKAFTENLTFYSKLGYRVEREEAFMGGICVHMNKRVRKRDEHVYGSIRWSE